MASYNNKKATIKGKSRKVTTEALVSDSALKVIRYILLACMCFFIFYPPFLRGLYFEDEQLPSQIFILLVFAGLWVYKFLKGDKTFLKTPIDYASFGFVIVYLISIVVAVSTRLAISEWLKYCMYFAVFFIITELATTFKSKKALLYTSVVTAVGLCIIGIDGVDSEKGAYIVKRFNAIFEFLNLNTRFFDLFVNGKIYSTLQYSNAFAAYLMGVYFIVLGLIVTSERIKEKVSLGSSMFIILTTLILTQSRGALIVFIPAAILFMLVLPKNSRVRAASYALSIFAVTALASIKLLGYTQNPAGNGRKIWLLVIGGMIVTELVVIGVNYLIVFLEKVSWKVYAGILGVIVLSGVIAGFVILTTSQPLELSHASTAADSENKIQKTVILKPNKEYKLIYEVNASVEKGKPNAYSIIIASKKENDLIRSFAEDKLVSYEGQPTEGNQKKELSFKVPDSSKGIFIDFVNTYQGTKAVFDNASIVDASTGKTAKNLILNYMIVPDSFASKFENIAISRSAVERQIFNRDAFKMFKDRWFLGAGGGAWVTMYFAYQSYNYSSTQAHNYFMQLATDCGIVGILVFVFLVIAIAACFITEYRNKGNTDFKSRVIQATLFTSIAAMFGHSLMDFDLSLSSVYILLWAFIAMFNEKYRYGDEDDSNDIEGRNPVLEKILNLADRVKSGLKLNLHPIIGLAVTVVIVFLPIFFFAGFKYSSAAFLKRNDAEAAAQLMKSAMSADPIKPQFKLDYVSYLVKKKNLYQNDVQEAKRVLDKAEKQCKNNADLSAHLGSNYISIAEFDKGLDYFDNAANLRPLRIEEWQQKLAAYYTVITYKQKENKNEGEDISKYVDRALASIEQAKEKNKDNMLRFMFNPQTQEALERLRYFKDYKNQVKDGDLDKIVFYGINNMDVDMNNIPDQWAPEIPEWAKVGYDNQVLTTKVIIPGKECFMRTRPLTFNPGKQYKIEVEFNKSPSKDTIPFTVTGVSEQNEGLKMQANNIYSAEIATPEDFKSNNNLFRVLVSEDYQIKNIRIIEK